ncbi:hypothetical protein QYY77_06215 [Xanthomonas campestris pv. campestris]|uniref:hypothetical protein n=1 Tax=Xanthomonas campestris TaxID=339 RepID=UPI002AD315B6|nr:hypothetical protein [Xanthomonas campestris]MEA0735677.1 hypothetical protein [Xanthomonas campestris pv. campestris]
MEWVNAAFYLGVLPGRLLGSPEYLARTYADFLEEIQMQQVIAQKLEIRHHRYVDRPIREQFAEEVAGISRKLDKSERSAKKSAN